jgi:hypothetical protein
MIRFFLRFLGLFCLAAAFILVIYDGLKSIAGDSVAVTNMRMLCDIINAGAVGRLEPLLKPYAHGLLWDPVMLTILSLPSWAVIGGLAVVLMLLGRKRKPLIGYAR